jgi:predicted HTH domain antitoxin
MVYAESRRSVFEHELVMSKFLVPINLEISPDSLSQGEQAILQEIALQLYARNIFTFGQARRLANLSVWEFQQLLGQQKIQRHYSETDLAEELDTIQANSWQS